MKTHTPTLERPIDLNTATREQLLALPGVGAVRADAILAARPFRSLQDLRAVPGIGRGTRRALSALVTVNRTCAPHSEAPARAMRAPKGRRVIEAAHLFRRPKYRADPNEIRNLRGMTWTPGQRDAIRAIRRHLIERPGEVFILKGYAGTGKTTLLVEALRPFRPPCMLAPTHKARAILAPKARVLYGTASTLHSWLGYRHRYDEETGESIFERDPSTWKPPKEGTPIVLDEVSMVGADMWREVVQVVRDHKILFIAMGDPLQLPPVGEPVSPAFASDQSASATLTQVMRSTGLLTDVVLQVRELIHQEAPPIIKASGADEHTSVEHLESNRALLSSLLEHTRAGEDVILLAWTNRVVDWVNAWMRQKIAGTRQEPFVEGEVLVATKPHRLWSDDEDDNVWDDDWRPDGEKPPPRFIHTETRLVVRDAFRTAHPEWGDDCWSLTLDGLGFNANPLPQKPGERRREGASLVRHCDTFDPVFALDKVQRERWRRRLKSFRDELRETKGNGAHPCIVRDLAERVGRYRDAYLACRPGYATTVHKSQGSTWQQVYVLQGDVAQNSKPFERNRLLYVAYSRASKRLVVYG